MTTASWRLVGPSNWLKMNSWLSVGSVFCVIDAGHEMLAHPEFIRANALVVHSAAR